MCTLCQTLNPKLETYDDHGIESLGEGTVSATYQVGSLSNGSGGSSNFSFGQIANYLTNGYWEDSGRDGRSFDVTTGDTLTVNLSGLDAKGAATAWIALDAWTAASGLKFEEIGGVSSAPKPPTAIRTETSDAVTNEGTTANLGVGEQFRGKISSSNDKDWIAIDLVKGEQYSINMSGDGSSGQITDTFLRLLNQQGQTIMQNDDRSAGDRYSAVDFTATYTGTYYVEAAGYGTNTGSYKVDVNQGRSTSSADITFQDSNSGAYAFSTVSGDTIVKSTINIDDAWTKYGSYYLQTYIHEIGHALGLGHAGDYNGNADFGSDAHYANDSWQTTVMSYFDQTDASGTNASKAYVGSAQMADIVAIQNLYGTPTNIHGGNSIYGEGQNVNQWGMGLGAGLAMTINDTGGTDLINLEQSTKNQVINLNDGTFSNINGKVGNVGISVGTIIENATTGSGNDRIIGNEADNIISSGAGNDTLFGNDGDDTFFAGSGADLIYGGAGDDTVVNDANMANFNVIYDVETVRDGVLKFQHDNGTINEVNGVETLVFKDATLNVAEIVADLKASYGAIPENSTASYTKNFADLGRDAPITPKSGDIEIATAPSMEIGSTRIEQENGSYWKTVTFEETIENAAVVMGPASSEGDQPLTIRVRDVSDTGFQFQIDEWDYLDGYHLELSVSWMAGTIGNHTMKDGTQVSFGQQSVNSTRPSTVNFSGFDDKPMIFAQLSGDKEDTALTHRLYDTDSDSFEFRLQSEEAQNGNLSTIETEDLYWVALDIASGSNIFESGTMALDHNFNSTGTTLQSNEAFFADMQTMRGPDTSGLRYDLGANGRVSLRVEEEQSRDLETSHISENVSWFTANEGLFDLV